MVALARAAGRRRPARARPARHAAGEVGTGRDRLPAVPGGEGRRRVGVAPCGLTTSAAFVFDVDGTLVHRGARRGARRMPGAVEVLEAIRASAGRSRSSRTAATCRPGARRGAARGRAAGRRRRDAHAARAARLLPGRRPPGAAGAWCSAPQAARERMAARAWRAPADATAAGRAPSSWRTPTASTSTRSSAPPARCRRRELLTASYAPAYCGRRRPDLQPRRDDDRRDRQGHRARARSSASPRRRPSTRSAARMGVPTAEVAVVGDDVALEVELGHIGGSHTVLVRSGMTGALDLTRRAGPPPAARDDRHRRRAAAAPQALTLRVLPARARAR